jgi:hypothetical protein
MGFFQFCSIHIKAIINTIFIILYIYKLFSMSTLNIGPVVNVDIIKTLGGFESQVIITWLGSLSEGSEGSLNESCGLLYRSKLL